VVPQTGNMGQMLLLVNESLRRVEKRSVKSEVVLKGWKR